MEILLNLVIEKFIAKAKLAPESESLKAFGELWLFEEGNKEEPIFKIKGWTIRIKEFGDQKVLAVVPPAIKSKNIYLTSFFINDKDLWRKVVALFLKEYAQLSGGLTVKESEKLDIDEISKEIDEEKGSNGNY